MAEVIGLEPNLTVGRLREEHGFSDESISLLRDKGFGDDDYVGMVEAMELPDETYAEKRGRRSRIEVILDRGDALDITGGRYERYVEAFHGISTEHVIVRGRMKFAVEYVIGLADFLDNSGVETGLIDRVFSDDEKGKLRSIYENFRTKDYVAAKLVERRTNHDIVAANTWVTIRAQQLGIDPSLMRRITHFARTSSDVNTNVTGQLYVDAIGQWTKSLGGLVSVLEEKARDYEKVTCVARTHGQEAQLTTLGHIYANLAEQIRLHAKPLLQEERLNLDGKIAGAIGTDVDMSAVFSELDPRPMYREIVENVFGLNYVELGNDQDCSNATLASALDTMVNVGNIVKKAATDTWLYASRHILAKRTERGESGSSIMPQKTNPFFAEGAEALMSITGGMINPIKEMMSAYREQGDLRRSITKREGFHPVMLSVIGIERLIGEIKKYDADPVALEAEIYESGPQIASSVIQHRLRERGMEDAYDRVKGIVMKPRVTVEEVSGFVRTLEAERVIDSETGRYVVDVMRGVIDVDGLMGDIYVDDAGATAAFESLESANRNVEARSALLGNAVRDSSTMADRARETVELLGRYAVVA
jgi:adenylosuccinate lyase